MAQPGGPYPHEVTVDLGATYQLDGLLHTGRPGTEPNGRIKEYDVLLSADGTTWARRWRPAA